MAEVIESSFEENRKAFLSFLKFTKGLAQTTCYNYNSDLGMWNRWLIDAKLDWRNCTPTDVEQFVAQLSHDGVGAHTVARKISCLATFYKWGKRNNVVQEDPIYQIEKPKRPRRMPVWLEVEEQAELMRATRNYDDIPENVFGRSREFSIGVRQRYELLFELFQKSALAKRWG